MKEAGGREYLMSVWVWRLSIVNLMEMGHPGDRQILGEMTGGSFAREEGTRRSRGRMWIGINGLF